MNWRPLVGVSGMRAERVSGLRRPGIGVSQRVLESVYRAGGDPVVLAPLAAVQRHPLDRLDAVVVPGGGDIDPRWYGQEQHSGHVPSDLVQDEHDLGLLRACLELRLPVLAICRGMQLLNVVCGGTLVPDVAPSAVSHTDAHHEVTLTVDGLVARAMGRTQVAVSSYHHQAIDTLGDQLVVTGTAADGVIEAVEHLSAPVLAVQWHPEDDAHEQPYQQALFDALTTSKDWHPTAGARA